MSNKTAAIRELLLATFNSDALTVFCFDQFQPIYGKFAPGVDYLSKIQLLIEYCDKHEQFDKLLAWIKEINPKQYGKFIPLIEESSQSSKVDIRAGINTQRVNVYQETKVLADNEEAEPTIGIITALPKEYAAVKALLENQQDYLAPGRGAGRRYLLGEVPAANGGKHSLVLSFADMGNNIAVARATLLLTHFPTINSVIMVGIAGGIPHPKKRDEHVRLGDVVVSNQGGVVQYDFDKETTAGIIYRYPPRPPSATLLEGVRLLQVAEIEGMHPWLKFIDQALHLQGVTRPPGKTDILVSSTHPEQKIRHPKDPKRVKGQPRIFIGPIASANKLLKNPIKRDELRDRFGVKAVEMEGSGIADATWNHEVGYLVVRGICDYCDSNKGDDWQDYAAVVAAAYTRALLESIPCQIPDPGPIRNTSPSFQRTPPELQRVSKSQNKNPSEEDHLPSSERLLQDPLYSRITEELRGLTKDEKLVDHSKSRTITGELNRLLVETSPSSSGRDKKTSADPDLINLIVEASSLLVEIAQDVFRARQAKRQTTIPPATTPPLPLDRPGELKTILQRIELSNQEMRINTIKSMVTQLTRHRRNWNDFSEEEIRVAASAAARVEARQLREDEEVFIKHKSLILKQQLEELTSYTLELPGLE